MDISKNASGVQQKLHDKSKHSAKPFIKILLQNLSYILKHDHMVMICNQQDPVLYTMLTFQCKYVIFWYKNIEIVNFPDFHLYIILYT